MLTPSRAESPPRVLVGLDIREPKSFSVASPANEFAIDCDSAYSRALSMLSIHSCEEYLLPLGSLVVFLGSSKTNCLSRWKIVNRGGDEKMEMTHCFH
jgi:hypothetical protein